MNAKPGAPRVLSLFGSLAQGAPHAERFVRIANGFGGRLRHFVVADDGDYAALTAIERGIAVDRLGDFPALSGLPLPGRMQAIARAMLDYHLVLTWGWNAIDGVLAHTSFSQVHELPPLIHHEDGSEETARQRSRMRSRWYRRVGLGKASGLVVPTETMEGAALEGWQQPIGRVKVIRDGVAMPRDAGKPAPSGIGRLLKREGELWIGCVTGFGTGEGIVPLVEALPGLAEEWHLVLLGEGHGQAEAEAAAGRLGIDHRVHVLPGGTDRAVAMPQFDLFVAPPTSELLPFAVIEAMAHGLAVVAPDTPDIAQALGPDNAGYLAEHADIPSFLSRLASDPYLRESLGAGNRERARAERDAKDMIAAYRRLYASAMKRDTL